VDEFRSSEVLSTHHAPSVHLSQAKSIIRFKDRLRRSKIFDNPTHLKYAATLPCNLSLTACFAESNASQGSVATYARCGGIFNMHLTANLPRNLPVKKNLKIG